VPGPRLGHGEMAMLRLSPTRRGIGILHRAQCFWVEKSLSNGEPKQKTHFAWLPIRNANMHRRERRPKALAPVLVGPSGWSRRRRRGGGRVREPPVEDASASRRWSGGRVRSRRRGGRVRAAGAAGGAAGSAPGSRPAATTGRSRGTREAARWGGAVLRQLRAPTTSAASSSGGVVTTRAEEWVRCWRR
jgi:hypothetical protein